MSYLFPFLDEQFNDTNEFRVAESAKDIRAAKPVREPTQRSSIFSFERAAVCYWVRSKRFQSSVSIQEGIGRR